MAGVLSYQTTSSFCKLKDDEYTSVVDTFVQSGITPQWFGKRFSAVVHITADFATREALNEKNTHTINPPNQKNTETTTHWEKDNHVLLLYGQDDLKKGMEDFLMQSGVSVYEVQNDGTPAFFDQLDNTAYKIVKQIAKKKNREYFREERRNSHIPPEPSERYITLDAKTEADLKNVLFPEPIYDENGSPIINKVDKRLQLNDAVHNGPNAIIVQFTDPHSGRTYLGKVLRRNYQDIYRNQTDKAFRGKIQQTVLETLTRESPQTIDSLRPAIFDWKQSELAALGKAVKPGDTLDPRLEYIVLMNVSSAGESLDKKFLRNVSFLPNLADALVEINKRSLVLSPQQAWEAANLSRYEEKFFTDFGYYLSAVTRLIKQGFIDPEAINLDRQKKVVDTIFSHPDAKRMRDNEIEENRVGNGLGNIHARNVFYNDYYHKKLITKASECFAFIDPADANPQLFPFTRQTFAGEASMMLVDVAARVPKKFSRQFAQKYIELIGIENDPHARANLVLEEALKSIARTHFAVRDEELPLAVKHAHNVNIALAQAGVIFENPTRINEKRAKSALIL